MLGMVSLWMVVVLCSGWVNCGFLLVVKLSFRFIVLGMVRMLENRIVVFSLKCFNGCSVIL